MLDANKEAKRLSSQINARMDIQGPQREFEKAEQRIDKTKRESKAKYEREQRQLGKQLEALGVNKHHRSSTLSVQGFETSGSRKSSTDSRAGVSTSNMSMGLIVSGPKKTSSTRDTLFPDQSTELPKDKTEEQCNQYRFLYETALQIFTSAEAQSKTEERGATRSKDGEKSTAEDEAKEPKGKRRAKSTVELKMMNLDTTLDVSSDKLQADRKKSPPALLCPKLSGASAGHSDSRKVSTESQSDSRKSSKADRGPSSSGQAMGQEPSMAISTDIPLTSGPAISLMLMVKALAGSEAGSKLDERAIKILKSIMDESRNAVKTIKSGCDSSRIQEKLLKRLTQLLEILKPPSEEGTSLSIPPEELLNCGYLRLSKENVERLEEMLIAEGIDPGIHAHSDITNINIFSDAKPGSFRFSTDEDDLEKYRKISTHNPGLTQPPPIYVSKQGVPLKKMSKPSHE